jgi:hypothetical protein
MSKVETEAFKQAEERRKSIELREPSFYNFSKARLIKSRTEHLFKTNKIGICPECRCRIFKHHVYRTDQGRLHQVKCKGCEDSYVCFFPSTYFPFETNPFDVYDVVGLWQDYDPNIDNLAKRMWDTFYPLCQDYQIKRIWLGKYNSKKDEEFERWI